MTNIDHLSFKSGQKCVVERVWCVTIQKNSCAHRTHIFEVLMHAHAQKHIARTHPLLKKKELQFI